MPFSRLRRLTLEILSLGLLRSFISRPLGSGANGRMDALIAATATEIAGHSFGDLRVGGSGRAGQQRGSLHDLPGLTVAALGHTFISPGDLHGMLTLGMQALDGGYGFVGDSGHLRDARTHRDAVDMHRAIAAKGGTASE